MIYAIDFDGTLAVTNFPKIIEPKEKMVAFTRILKEQGHKIILWTCRSGEDLEAAIRWCKLMGIEFDAVNEALPEQINIWGNDTRKIYADVYIDDKCMNIQKVEEQMDEILKITQIMLGNK